MPTVESTIDLLHRKHSMDIVRGHLRKIVETYDLEWRIVHELVQNAIDAIQANPKVSEGQVDLVLDIDNDEVKIMDNGTGFTNDTKLLCPNGTGAEKHLSSRSPAKGYQGVGLKAVMYSTTLFEIESQTDKEHWTFLAENLADYIDSTESNVPEYAMEITDSKDDTTYTTITARFRTNTLCEFLSGLNRFLNEDSVRWRQLYKEERRNRQTEPIDKYLGHFLSWYFRTQSYVGCANRLLNILVKNVSTNTLEEVKPVTVQLKIKSHNQFVGIDGVIGRWLQDLGTEVFTTEIPNKAWDYSEIVKENQSGRRRNNITPKIRTLKPNDPNWNDLKEAFRNDFLDLKLTPDYNKDGFRERYADFIAILERQRSRVKAEDYKDVLEKITGIYLAIGRTSYFEQLGITNHGIRIIASNGTPTDHSLSVTSTSSTWYQETIHMIINVDVNLNVGKRHLVNSRFVGRINDFYQACYPVLVNISKQFVERDPNVNNDDPLPSVVDLKKLRREEIPFRRFPSDENTLVGLFSAAFCRLDNEFSVYSYFGKERYDGKFSWYTNEVRSDSELLTLEFKVQLEKLIDEFDVVTDNKEFRDVDLIIVWDRTLNHNDWEVKGISLEIQNRLEQRRIPTDIIEYVLEDQYGNVRPLICMADLLQKFNLINDETDDLDAFVEELG